MTSVLAAVALVAGSMLVAVNPAVASKTPKPVITGLTATPPKVTEAGDTTTIAATVSNATACRVSSSPLVLFGDGSVSCASGSLTDTILFPKSTTSTVYVVTVTAKGPGGDTSMSLKLKVIKGAGGGISGVQSMASDGEGSCALLDSGGVDCWGYGLNGQLGNGQFYVTAPNGSAVPVPVEDVGGTGTLAGVASLIGANSYGYCALLDSGGVDCWGFGQVGGLGDGQFSDSASPVQVLGVGGNGVLSGVSSLAGDGLGFCALLTSGGVDCWGYGPNGELGDGQLYSSSPYGSATPVQVESTDGNDVLSGVSSVTSGDDGYCALASGGVDCWGNGVAGPVQVEGVDGNGVLSGASSVMGDSTGAYCALLTSGGVDCWGYGANGELGDGQFYSSGSDGSATPVEVEDVSGDGVLSDVSSVMNDQDGFCVLLGSDEVDCWGNGTFGILGNGQFSNSATPVQVEGLTGGLLRKVSVLIGDGNGFCVLLSSSAVDCWGEGGEGGLGNGQYYSNPDGSAVPVEVVGVHAIGTLFGVAAVTGGGDGYCALLTSTGVDCWGAGTHGDLGNGTFYPTNPGGSAVPVPVF